MEKLLLICSVALLLNACGDPKAANKKNFTAAIQQAIAEEPALCVGLPRSAAMLVETKAQDNSFYFHDVDTKKLNEFERGYYAQAEALTKLGLLSKVKVKKPVLTLSFNQKKQKQTYLNIALVKRVKNSWLLTLA